MSQSLTLDTNQVTSFKSIGVSVEKVKSPDASFAPIGSYFADGQVGLKYKNFILEQQEATSLYNNSMVNLYLVYEWNNWPSNSNNKFTIKKFVYLAQSN